MTTNQLKKNLSQINPEFETSKPLKDSFLKAINSGFNQYSRMGGDVPLLEELSTFYNSNFGTNFTWDQFSVTHNFNHVYSSIFYTFLPPQKKVASIGPLEEGVQKILDEFGIKTEIVALKF